MGQNLNRENKRTHKVTLSFTTDEFAELESKAIAEGFKPSTVARRLLLEHLRFFAK